ncbi:MAG: RCC1 domain-containing protein [Polyangiales bacterium]
MVRSLLFVLVVAGCSSSSNESATADSSSVEAASTDSESDSATSMDDGSSEASGDASVSIIDIAATGEFSCAVSSTGRLRCWGDNRQGQLGDGTLMQHATPNDVSGIAGATAVAAAAYHTCAIVTGGAVKCWGNNYSGVLGDGTSTRSGVPIDVEKVSGAKSITTGEGHTCAILADATLTCWGSNQYGQLGDPKAPHPSKPVVAIGTSDVVAVGTGNGFTCVAHVDGTASCWGAGSEGELGDGTSPFSRTTPGPVQGLSTVKGLTAGQGHACALLEDGTVRCWGSNTSGQLGSGKTDKTSSVPLAVLGITGAKAIQALGSRTCALLEGGAVSCWGPTAVPVEGLTGATKMAVGGCAIVGPGVKCWGSNDYGQLGDGSTKSSTTPVSVIGLP